MEELAIFGGKPVRENKIFYGRQYIDQADVDAVAAVMTSRRRIALQRGLLIVPKQLKSLFQADFGHKKAHRNFDRNQLRWELLPIAPLLGKSICFCYARQTGSCKYHFTFLYEITI